MLRSALTWLSALAAVSVSSVKSKKVPGAERRSVTDVTFDASYAEGGESVTASQLGLNRVDEAVCNLKNGSEGAGGAEEVNPVSGAWYDADKEILHLQDGKTGKEIAKETDMSKVVVRVIAWGS